MKHIVLTDLSNLKAYFSLDPFINLKKNIFYCNIYFYKLHTNTYNMYLSGFHVDLKIHRVSRFKVQKHECNI